MGGGARLRAGRGGGETARVRSEVELILRGLSPIIILAGEAEALRDVVIMLLEGEGVGDKDGDRRP